MKGKVYQAHAALAASFGQLVMGSLNVWPSYTSSLYKDNATTPLSDPLSPVAESLLGSLPSLGAMAGTAVAGLLINKFGRVLGGIIISLPCVLSWSLISVTSSITLILVARFLGGVTGGAGLVFAPILISEVAQDDFRGTLASCPILMYCIGSLLSYVLGWTSSYSSIIWINLAASVMFSLLVYSIKETPSFLLSQMKDEDARESIAHYRGVSPSSATVLDELARLKHQLIPAVELIAVTGEEDTKAEESEKEKLNTEYVQPEEQKKQPPIKLLFTSPSSRRALFVLLTVISLQVFMGMVPVQVYAKEVFKQAYHEHADMLAVVFALVLMCGSLITAGIADKAGRRVLLFSSAVLVCVLMSALGYWLHSGSSPPYVTVILILLYCFSFMAGAGSIPYVLLAEIFTSEVQSVASLIVIEWVWFLNFVILAVFPIMNNTVGIHGSFYCFAAFAFIDAVVSYFIVPETKGLSNEKIQALFMGKKC